MRTGARVGPSMTIGRNSGDLHASGMMPWIRWLTHEAALAPSVDAYDFMVGFWNNKGGHRNRFSHCKGHKAQEIDQVSV